MSDTIDKAEAERHRAKMAKRKAVQDAEVAGKTIEKGLLIVHTGTGKGKSTAAFGLALRMLGRGHRVGVVQFIKGAWHSAERDALAQFGDQVVWHTMGEGFTWETQDRIRDVAAAGLLQATSLPFIVAATTIGLQLHAIGPANAAALVAAGLFSVIIFPIISLQLLRSSAKGPSMTPEQVHAR